jgi:uncharacterized protein involved in exopolysaccharide biosynthesis
MDIIEIIRTVKRYFAMILIVTFLVTAVSTASSFLFRKKYVATAKLVTSQKNMSDFGNAGGLLGVVTGSQQGLTVVYMKDIAVSDAIARKVIEELKLAQKSDLSGPELDDEDRLSIFHGNLNVMIPDDYTVTISYVSSDPRLSSEVSNEVAEQTTGYAKNIAMEDYEQYKNVVMLYRKQLRELEIRIKVYEERHGLFKIDDQLSKTIEDLSKYKMQIVEKQSELESLQKLLDNTTDIYLWTGTRQRIASLKEEIRVINSNISAFDTYMKTMPEMKREYAEMLRDQNTISLKLAAADLQQDMKKLDSERVEHRFRVLDAAYPSKWQVWPRKKFFAAVGFATGFVLSLIIAFVKDTMKKEEVYSQF